MISRRSIIKRSTGWIPLALIIVLMTAGAGQFLGCEPEDWEWTIDCGQCYDYKPDSAKLVVYLTINAENDSVPLIFYRGDYEDGEIDWIDTATTEELLLFSEMDREYTVRAQYKSGSKTIMVFDSDKMYLSNYADDCGSPCYIVKSGIFDVRLLE